MAHKKNEPPQNEKSSEDRRNNEFLGLYEVLSPSSCCMNTTVKVLIRCTRADIASNWRADNSLFRICLFK